jgi:hypothetical protein
MTDDELMQAAEIKTIAKHLEAATKAVRALEKRSGRKLCIFVEAEAGPYLVDNEITMWREDNRRLQMLNQGGGTVKNFGLPFNWGCGAI